MAQGHESRRINEEPSMAAPDFSCTLADQTVMEGLRVVLSCCGKGDPQPNVTWYHQGHEVVSNRRLTFMQDGEKLSLVLQSALLSDQGCYQCVLCNCAGKASCQGHLQVIAAVPIPIEDAPLVKKVTCEAIVLSWKPPKIFMALTAGITYAVQYQADGQGPWIVLASRVVETSYTARSLSPGSHYRFRILLVTPQGCSNPSPPSAPCLLPGDREAVIEDLLHKERRITDEYIIKEEIGWGSFGVVHCVSNIVTSTDYAAKLIPASRGHREDALRELRILKSLRHPHVIQLHDMFYGHRSIIALLELYPGKFSFN